jgi:CPA2 family monovalent cation:H+ antiporter-2
VAVAVSVITTLLTPYLIRAADPLSIKLAAAVPSVLARVLGMYGEWLRSIQPQGEGALLASMIRKILLQVGVNLALVIAIFFAGAYFAERISMWLQDWISDPSWQKALIWGGALLLSLPFLIAAYRKLKALSMLLAEMGVKPEMAGRHTQRVRRVIAEVIPILSLLVIFLLIGSLVGQYLADQQVAGADRRGRRCGSGVLWRWFIRVHTRMQVALLETLDNHKESSGH